MPVCCAFQERFPEIKLEIAISDELSNLSKREADVALRTTLKPKETLLGRKLGEIVQAVYGPAGHPAASETKPNWTTYDWVGPDASLSYPPLEQWMTKNHLDDRTGCRVNTLLGMREAMLIGMGLTVLPCYLCDPDTRFVRIGRPIPELRTELWFLTHPDLKSVSRIRAFLEFVTEAISAKKPLLAGQAN